jgi:hypothetical protein
MENQLTQETQPANEDAQLQPRPLSSFHSEVAMDDRVSAVFFLVSHYGRFDFGNRMTCRRWHENIQ